MGPIHHTTGGGGGQCHTPTTPQGGEGEDLIWDQYMGPIHHTTGGGGGQCHTPTTPQGGRGKISYGTSIWDPSHMGGGRGGVAGPGAYMHSRLDRCTHPTCQCQTIPSDSKAPLMMLQSPHQPHGYGKCGPHQ